MSDYDRDIVLLEQIIESVGLISQYVQTLDLEDFLDQPQIQDAVLRRLQIIGESAKGVSESLRTCYQDIPWKRMAGMRDVVVHQYWSVDLILTWNTVTETLPDLLPLLNGILKDLER